jgi:hypothetical protein
LAYWMTLCHPQPFSSIWCLISLCSICFLIQIWGVWSPRFRGKIRFSPPACR